MNKYNCICHDNNNEDQEVAKDLNTFISNVLAIKERSILKEQK